MSELLLGEVEIPFEGGSATLKADLFAATRINRHFGGIQPAVSRIAAMDLDAYIAVVRFGLGIKTDAEAKGLDEKVFAAGLIRLINPLTDFLMLIANGGRPDAEPRPGEAPGKS